MNDACEGRSPWAMMWRRLRRNRVALAGAAILGVLYALAFFAGFFAPYHYDHQFRDTPLAPPHLLGGVHFRDAEGVFHWRPFVYGRSLIRTHDEHGEVILRRVEDPHRRHPIRLFVRGDEWRLLGLIRTRVHLFGVDPTPNGAAPTGPEGSPDPPGVIYLLGSDLYGRDIFSRLCYGGLVSLTVGLVGIAISMSLGLLLGGIAGYFGGRVDFALMRIIEVIMAVPGIYLILTLRAAFPRSLSSIATYFLVVIILAFIAWASNARVIRGMVLSLREQDYVAAARALGISHLGIIVRHILPNTLSYVIVTATLYVPYYILGEVALSFLGVGIQEPEASWGLMLRDAQHATRLVDNPHLVMPGLLVFVAVLAFNFLGDGLRDAADPRSVLKAKTTE
ncbi:MAG: ABC transporter permease [Planctomycetales bacterium]|nr:ABC transporter permease [Planctomycetales bacterium]